MSDASTTLHEPAVRLSGQTLELHRALVSLQEELEAVDWYRQRADACDDDELKAVLLHNMREEIEHASMVLEWLRRNHADFARHFDTYLYSTGSIVDLEHDEEAEGGTPDSSGPEAADAVDVLTVGSLKE